MAGQPPIEKHQLEPSVQTALNVLTTGIGVTGQVLTVAGTSLVWQVPPGAGALYLGSAGNPSSLSDVVITTPVNYQLLQYNAGLNQWENVTVPVSTPGGLDTQVQYNALGAFAGSNGFTYNYTTGTLSLAPNAGTSFTLLLTSSPTGGGSVLDFIAPTNIGATALGLNMRFDDTLGILGYVGYETANSNNLALTLHNTRATGEVDLITAGGQLRVKSNGQVTVDPVSGDYNLLLTNNSFNIQLSPQTSNNGTSIYFGDSNTGMYAWQLDAGYVTAGEFTIRRVGVGPVTAVAYNQSGAWKTNGSYGTSGQLLVTAGTGGPPSWTNTSTVVGTELNGLSGLSTTGLVTRTAAGAYTTRSIATSTLLLSSGDGVSGNPTIDLNTTAVTAGTYGTATQVPSFTVDAYGRLTGAANITITPTLPFRQIAFGDGSNLQTSSAALTFNDTPGNATLILGKSTDGTAYISSHVNGFGDFINLSINAGEIGLAAGAVGSIGQRIALFGGTGTSGGVGGDIDLEGGTASGSGTGGNINVVAGQGNTSTGGNIVMYSGQSTSGNGGSISFLTTPDVLANYVTRLQLTRLGEWVVNGSVGTAGQVLTSGGAGVAPTWTTTSGTSSPTDVLFATAAQTVFNTTNATTTSRFPTGTVSYIQVFVNGILQREDNSTGTAYAITGTFYVSGANQITFFSGLSLNDEVTIYQL